MSTPSSDSINILDLWNARPLGQPRSEPGLLDPIGEAARLGFVARCLDLCGGRPFEMGSALLIALQARRLPLATALIEAGAWAGAPAGSPAVAADGAEQPSPSLVQQWGLLALHAPDAATLNTLLSAMERSGRPIPGPEQLAEIALGQFDYAKALEIVDCSKIPFSEKLFGQLAAQASVAQNSLLKPFWAVFDRLNAPSTESSRQQEALAELLFNRAPIEFPAFLRSILWHHAIGNENCNMIGRLAAGGHFPEAWACPEAEAREPAWLGSGSFLSRSFLKFPEGTAFLSQIPAAVEDALRRPPKPEFIANLPVFSLMEMARLGIDLTSKASTGQTFLHLWAVDSSVRSGWTWVARAMPELLRAQDCAGESPIDIQRSVLAGDPKKLRRFDEMIAGFERSAISKAVGGAGKAIAANSRKPRL